MTSGPATVLLLESITIFAGVIPSTHPVGVGVGIGVEIGTVVGVGVGVGVEIGAGVEVIFKLTAPV